MFLDCNIHRVINGPDLLQLGFCFIIKSPLATFSSKHVLSAFDLFIKQQYTHIFSCTSLLVQKQKNKEENHVPSKTCPALHAWWCFLLDMLRRLMSSEQHKRVCHGMESPCRLSLVLLQCLLSGIGVVLDLITHFHLNPVGNWTILFLGQEWFDPGSLKKSSGTESTTHYEDLEKKRTLPPF